MILTPIWMLIGILYYYNDNKKYNFSEFNKQMPASFYKDMPEELRGQKINLRFVIFCLYATIWPVIWFGKSIYKALHEED